MGDVLKIISASPGDLHPVFGTMLQSAARLCGANYGMLFRCNAAGFAINAGTPHFVMQQKPGW